MTYRPKLTAEDIAEIQRLRAEGVPWRMAGARFGVTGPGAYNAVRSATRRGEPAQSLMTDRGALVSPVSILDGPLPHQTVLLNSLIESERRFVQWRLP